MKKLFIFALTAAMALSLTACGGSSSSGQQPQSSTPAAPAASSTPASSSVEQPTVYTFLTAEGESVSVNALMSEVLERIGQPQSYFEAESCAFNGLDKTYTYPGFVITTRPDGELDFINSILLTDDSVTTAEGAYIGMAKADVVGIYGPHGSELGSLLAYTLGDCTLNFIIDNDAVISIEYLPAGM